MSRVSASTPIVNETVWEEDHWYRVTLRSYEIEPKGTPGYRDQPTKHKRLLPSWHVEGTGDDLVFDWITLNMRPPKGEAHAKIKLLVCALAGRDPRQEPNAWIDDDTLEFGFDAESAIVAGRIVQDVAVAIKGSIKQDSEGTDRLRIERYGPVHLANTVSPQQVAGPTAILSQDGRYVWNGQEWRPVPPPPPVPSPPPPTPTDLI